MKTNLDVYFKTNETTEKGGEWCEIAPGVRFLIARLGGVNADRIKKANAQFFKPHARRIQNGSLPVKEEQKILARVFVEVSLLGWEGVLDDNDQPLEFSKDNAVNLLVELPELFGKLTEFSQDVENYKSDLGNY